jgi:hypothetical protein
MVDFDDMWLRTLKLGRRKTTGGQKSQGGSFARANSSFDMWVPLQYGGRKRDTQNHQGEINGFSAKPGAAWRRMVPLS